MGHGHCHITNSSSQDFSVLIFDKDGLHKALDLKKGKTLGAPSKGKMTMKVYPFAKDAVVSDKKDPLGVLEFEDKVNIEIKSKGDNGEIEFVKTEHSHKH